MDHFLLGKDRTVSANGGPYSGKDERESERATTTPPGGIVVPVLPAFGGKSDRWLLEEAVRRSHHAWEAGACAQEWTRELAKNTEKKFAEAAASAQEREERTGRRFAGIEQRLGIAEQRPAREGSHPVLDDLAKIGTKMAELHLEDEKTEVKVRQARADLARREGELKLAQEQAAAEHAQREAAIRLAEAEAARKLAAMNRKRVWGLVWKAAAVAGPVAAYLVSKFLH